MSTTEAVHDKCSGSWPSVTALLAIVIEIVVPQLISVSCCDLTGDGLRRARSSEIAGRHDR